MPKGSIRTKSKKVPNRHITNIRFVLVFFFEKTRVGGFVQSGAKGEKGGEKGAGENSGPRPKHPSVGCVGVIFVVIVHNESITRGGEEGGGGVGEENSV